MKVKYLKQHTDQYNFTFQAGWTAEHDEPTGNKLIADGICERVADTVRPTRHPSPAVAPLEACIVPDVPVSVGPSEKGPTRGKFPPDK